MLPRRIVLGSALAALTFAPAPAAAADREVIDARVDIAFRELYAEVPGAEDLAARAKGILMMPKVVKGGFILGGSYGEGGLRLNVGEGYSNTVDYYSVAAASVGLQAGVQESSHALFFLTTAALEAFRRSEGYELGVDAEAALPGAGFNIGTNSSILQKPVVAFVFGEDGLMLGASLEGAKYTRILR